MSVRIVSDSACDLTPQEAQKLGVTVLPIPIRFGEEEYLDRVTISVEDFYAKLKNYPQMPQTSQITPDAFARQYRTAAEAGDETVVLTLSGKLSGTYQNAVSAAQETDGRVWVVDTLTVTLGQRIMVLYAVRLRDMGWTGQKIAEEMLRVRDRVTLIARVDTLEYLMRGGRLSKTAAIAGTMLGIKPVLGVKNGEVVVLGKARGLKNSGNLLTELINRCGVDFALPLALGYSGTDDRLLKSYIEDSRELWKDHLAQLPSACAVGSAIGTHAGPGAIALAFFAAKEKGDI